jgi:hypothetical protein
MTNEEVDQVLFQADQKLRQAMGGGVSQQHGGLPPEAAQLISQEVQRRVGEQLSMIPALPGPAGKDGTSVTVEDVMPIIEDLVAQIPTPKDGQDGKNGKPGEIVRTIIKVPDNTLEQSDGSSRIGFVQSGSGLILSAGTVSGKLSEFVSVRDEPFGALGDGITDDTAAVQAAIDAMEAVGGGTVYFPRGIYLCTGLTVTGTSVSLVGESIRGTRLRFTDTDGTLLTITGSLFSLRGFEFETPAATHTTGAIFDLQASQGNISDIRINGAFWDVFKMESSAADDWIFDKVRVVGGNTLNSCWRLKSASGTVADTHIINPILATTATWTEAAIILDTLVDTFRITGGTLGGIGKIIHIKDSGSGQDPRFIHISDVYLEDSSSTGDLVTIDAGDDIRFTNCYLGLALNHAVINSGRDIAFKNNHFISPKRTSIDYNGGNRVAIVGNTFLDASQETDVTYSTIDVAAGLDEFRIEGNTFRLRSGITNKPLRQLTIASGSSDQFFIGDNDWGIAGTDYGAAGVAAVLDASSGTNVVITDNIQTVLYRGDTTVSHTGTTDATAKISVTLPAGSLRTRDGIEIEVGGTTAGTGGTKTIAATFGGSSVSTIVVPQANTDTWTIRARIVGANSVTAQSATGQSTRTAADTEGTVIRNKSASYSIDTTAAVTITVTCTLANSGDTIVIRTCDIRVVRR